MTISRNNYRLEIVSRDRRHEGKIFKSYAIDGKQTIGVSKKEPFEIRFRNLGWQRVQVRFSMDGTDILTGEPATTDPNGKMWLVEGHASMTLKAWPESNSGGACFVFGSAGKSVAVNTHGNVEGVGVIAAAVFVEGATRQQYYSSGNINLISDSDKYMSGPRPQSFGRRRQSAGGQSANRGILRSTSKSKGFDSKGFDSDVRISASDSLDDCDTKCSTSGTMGFMESEMEMGRDVDFCVPCSAAAAPIEYEPKAAIGAGEYVAQELVKGKGLEQPKYSTALEVHYKWWSEVRSALTKFGGRRDDSPNPFPGDDDNHIDLSYTPRQGSTSRKIPRCPFAQYL